MTSQSWGFHNPVRIRFGRGARSLLAQELGGTRCLIVTSARGRAHMEGDSLLAEFLAKGEHCWADGVTANPDADWLESERERLRDEHFGAVIGFGGGSAIDSAKVLAVTLATGQKYLPLRDLLADPALHADAQPVPLYALPTTAGTGSEVTPFSTVWDHSIKKKFSLAGPAVYPTVAVVDPALTDGLPGDVTLSTGLDAINQAAESVWNRNATPITLELAARALALGFGALPDLMESETSADRDALAECSLLAGLAISQTRTALCHSISYPLTAHFGVPHGLACAFTMPTVLRLNLQVEDERFVHLAKRLVGPGATVTDLVSMMDRIYDHLDIGGRVRRIIGDYNRLLEVTPEMHTLGRADNNLAAVDVAVIRRIIEESWFGNSA